MLMETARRDNVATPAAITVCMAAYNEEAVIAETIQDCLATLDEIPGRHSILVVNDGSTDRTGEILETLASRQSRIRVLTHQANQGIAAAARWLFREAQGNLIFYTAADGEWRARELNGLLEKLAEGYEIVVGVRRKRQYGAYRLAVSWLYNLLVRVLFGQNFHDIGSITLAHSQIWKRVPAQSNSAFFFAEILLLAARNSARIGFCPVEHVRRSTGRSKFNNPLRALEAFGELFAFWLSPRSRRKIDLGPWSVVKPSRFPGDVSTEGAPRPGERV
jgi:glycosyltransferase involved in cell wall biosynthesis